jgi:hypothetical protein
MRKLFIIVLLLIIAVFGYLAFAHFSGGQVPTFGLPIGGEKVHIRARVNSFFEHVKFKNTSVLNNFIKASPEELSVFLNQLGLNEDVDLKQVKIEEIELDSSETRARVRIKILGTNLKSNEAIEISKILFLYLEGQWMIDKTFL